ncbi:MAG: transketolase C-terminal domain-containing protein [Desulfuromonadaceae bacterium]|nr:transketolase C-terminal domain-containing protein [Desulfuromonadaceae bacterium]MDD5104199.1 transketolase C-terminal domain-containing protein [Desulfuromonadaceae bacterium]
MKPEVMRDLLIEDICLRMKDNKKIFFLSADFGSPALDQLRADFPDRFFNVGIAEQNLVSIAAGLGLEGFTVYAYAIAPFISMRAFEQIRISLALMGQTREVNVNMIGVGAGLSYDVTGPTHHCLEDIALMNLLPNISVISPSDATFMKDIVSYTLVNKKPSYIRLDGKALPRIYDQTAKPDFNDGFCQICKGEKICIVATGYMTHVALKTAEVLKNDGISVGVIDIYLVKSPDMDKLKASLNEYSIFVTMEEGFIRKGGLDALITSISSATPSPKPVYPLGFDDQYVFEVGDRKHLHALAGLGEDRIIEFIKSIN